MRLFSSRSGDPITRMLKIKLSFRYCGRCEIILSFASHKIIFVERCKYYQSIDLEIADTIAVNIIRKYSIIQVLFNI